MWNYTGAHLFVSYHSECLRLVDCRQPGVGSVDSASWTALWERRILGQQVKEGMTREHLQRSEYTMRISLYQDKKSQCRYSESVEQQRRHVLNWPHLVNGFERLYIVEDEWRRPFAATACTPRECWAAHWLDPKNCMWQDFACAKINKSGSTCNAITFRPEIWV